MMAEPMLSIRDLTVRYGATVAIADLDLEVTSGEVVCVLGPSGCGKSTLLRAIAGLEPVRKGSIELERRSLDGLRPDQRGIGLMFQDGALFPHRDVRANVAFGLRMQGRDRDDIGARVDEVLGLVGLAGFGDRAVASLSGGEQQRVALARAIAPEPRLLMLDEPLGSLDRALRDRLMSDLARLFSRLGLTVVYVTHDQDEALALADRVVVMRAGSIEQIGAPDQVWREPATEFVATFLGQHDILDAIVAGGIADTVLGPVAARERGDGPARVLFLPDALRLGTGLRGEPAGTVAARRFAGDHVVLAVDLDDGPQLTVPVWGRQAPQVGDAVTVAVDPAATVVFGRPA